MNSLDILFWLLIALLAGVAWSIEAGLAARHRKMLACSTLSAFASILFIMFWIEDNSFLDLQKAGPIKVKQKTGDRGEFEYEVEEQAGGSSDKSSSRSGAGAGKAPGPDGKDNNTLTGDYSRAPFRDCRNCPEMVLLPAGNFEFGAPRSEPGRAKDEPDAIFATIEKPFAISRLEILRSEFAAFIKASGYKPASECDIQIRTRHKWNWQRPGFEQHDEHPVVCISWTDAREYVWWLSKTSGRSYSLLSEKQWEYAARAGTKSPFWTGQGLQRSQANFARTRDGTIPAGLMPANPFGLGGVLGNAAEMTSTCIDAVRTKSASIASDPEPDVACTSHIVKGGAWNSNLPLLRSSARTAIGATTANNYTGFRIGRAIDQRDDIMRLTVSQKQALAAADKAARAIEAAQKVAEEKAIREAELAAEKAAAAKEAAAIAKAEAKAKAAKK